MPSEEQLAAYLAGSLPEDERLDFERGLVSDAETRREIISQQQISAGLRALLANDADRVTEAILAEIRGLRQEVPVGKVVRANRPAARPRGTVRCLAAAVAVLAFAAMIYPFVVPREAARMTRGIAAVWDGPAPKVGEGIPPRWLKLRGGAVELEFASGARATLEGPAEFQLRSGMEAFLHTGRVRAVVPARAHGFTIRGDGFAATDLGTEFGVIAGKVPEVHVFAGRVAFQGMSGKVMGAAEALRLSNRVAERIPANPELFAGKKRFVALEAAAALDTHPAALVHYDFSVSGNTLANRVPGEDLTANVAGCREAEGRWPGSPALEFGGERDHVAFSIPADMQSITLMAWVRVDALPLVQSSLLMGSSELPGDVHWYLHRGAVVGFAVVGSDGEWHHIQTPVIMRARDFGHWRCLAVTYDGATGWVTHYIDGRPVTSRLLGTSVPLRPGSVQVGNWALRPGAILRASKKTNPADFQRALQGRIDELAVFSSALDAGEILSFYETGAP